MIPSTLSQAFDFLDQAKDLLADVVSDDPGISVECHTLSEQIEEFLSTHEIDN